MNEGVRYPTARRARNPFAVFTAKVDRQWNSRPSNWRASRILSARRCSSDRNSTSICCPAKSALRLDASTTWLNPRASYQPTQSSSADTTHRFTRASSFPTWCTLRPRCLSPHQTPAAASVQARRLHGMGKPRQRSRQTASVPHRRNRSAPVRELSVMALRALSEASPSAADSNPHQSGGGSLWRLAGLQRCWAAASLTSLFREKSEGMKFGSARGDVGLAVRASVQRTLSVPCAAAKLEQGGTARVNVAVPAGKHRLMSVW